MNILYASSECHPFSKTGGLGDVAGALPVHLARHETVVRIIPWHKNARTPQIAPERLLELPPVPGFPRNRARVHCLREDQLDALLIEEDSFYSRPELYGPGGGSWGDNFERFLFFQLCILELIRQKLLAPDIIHVNDWQTALLPTLCQWHLQLPPPTVLTIHNLAYQGIFPGDHFRKLNMPPLFFSPQAIEFHGQVNCLKTGILSADRINTVSPTYAGEILEPGRGEGMEGVLATRRNDLSGILNGMDREQWNPFKDPFLTPVLDPHTPLECRQNNKEALCSAFQLDPMAPLLVVVSRLAPQKGMDLVLDAWDGLKALGFNLLVLGSGAPALEQAFSRLARHNPGKLAFSPGFDEPLAHRMMAGGDFLLMPSRFEPCGLTQMYAMRYGCLPVVLETGGLRDTVSHPDLPFPRGLALATPTPEALLQSCHQALHLYRERKEFLGQWRLRIMALDLGWEIPARLYRDLYQDLCSKEK